MGGAGGQRRIAAVSYHHLPNGGNATLNRQPTTRNKGLDTLAIIASEAKHLMHRSILALTMILSALWTVPSFAQSRSQLGPLCTTDTTPADQQIDACNKIIALKVFSGAQLANVYFWRAVGWNKKGNYAQVIADTTEALRLKPDQALYNLRGSAYFDKGEYDIAIADFNDALRSGPPSGTLFHNRGNAYRGKGDYAKAIADYDSANRLSPNAYSLLNRGLSKQALGDLDGALADINEAIRLDPSLPSGLIDRAVVWRAKGDLDRAIADGTEAIRLAKAKAPVNIMTPPGSVLISAYTQRALAYEAKGDFDNAKKDYAAVLEGRASDAGSKANQATAKVRLSLLSEAPAAAPAAERGHRSRAVWRCAEAGGISGAGAERGNEPARGARDRQRHLCARQGPAQPLQRRALDRQEPARHRIYGDRRHRPRPGGDAEHDPRIPARSGAGADCGGLLCRPWRAGRRPQLSGAGRHPVSGRHRRNRSDDGHGYDHGRSRRPGSHQHPDPRRLPQQSDGAKGCVCGHEPRHRGRHRSRLRPRRTDLARRRFDAGRRHLDCVCDRARTGGARRRRRQQPVLGGAVAPHRHARDSRCSRC